MPVNLVSCLQINSEQRFTYCQCLVDHIMLENILENLKNSMNIHSFSDVWLSLPSHQWIFDEIDSVETGCSGLKSCDLKSRNMSWFVAAWPCSRWFRDSEDGLNLTHETFSWLHGQTDAYGVRSPAAGSDRPINCTVWVPAKNNSNTYTNKAYSIWHNSLYR